MSKKLKQVERLKQTAYHEAGHAVAAHFKRIGFRYVTIKPDVGAGSLGHIQYRYRGLLPMEYAPAWWIKNNVVVCYAGTLAERIISARYNHQGASADHSHAVDLGLRIWGDGDRTSRGVSQLFNQTKEWVNRAEVKRCIDAIAAALLERETLSRKEVGAIIRKAQEKTQ